MSSIHVKRSDPGVRAICKAAFPDYRGRSITLGQLPESYPLDGLHWDGGSRTEYVFVRLDTRETLPLSTVIPTAPWQTGASVLTPAQLPENVALVTHQISCGADVGISIMLRPGNMTSLLPAPVELTDDERAVLVAHVTYIASYRREHLGRAGIVGDRLEAAYTSLVDRGLLTRSRRINNNGKNAVS